MRTRLTWNLARTVAIFAALSTTVAARKVSAETNIAKGDNWEVFLSGRVNAFFGYARGDGYPNNTFDQNGELVREPKGGGLDSLVSRPPANPATPNQPAPGTIEDLRVRSGFSSNVFGFGLRRQVTESTKLTAYMSIWSIIESENRRKYIPVVPDVREGYMKFEGPWGSFLAGRALTLYDRGASEIDFLYAHGFALGYPGSIDIGGPGAGQIGFGVLGAGFASGFMYATPTLAGLQLSIGYYDPANLVGSAFERTKFGRPEAELTFDFGIGKLARVHLFGNGTWQQLYQNNTERETRIYGVGGGGRFEVGGVHLGLASHYGRGLGLYYALQPDVATYTEDGTDLRRFVGYYAQLQVVLGHFDVSSGYGITSVYQAASDPANTMNSYIKNQIGINAGIVYHVRDYLALDIDYFRADFNWWRGEKQLVHFVNSGVTMLW